MKPTRERGSSSTPNSSHALHFIAHNIFTVKADLQVNDMQFVNLIFLTEGVGLHHPDHSAIISHFTEIF